MHKVCLNFKSYNMHASIKNEGQVDAKKYFYYNWMEFFRIDIIQFSLSSSEIIFWGPSREMCFCADCLLVPICIKIYCIFLGWSWRNWIKLWDLCGDFEQICRVLDKKLSFFCWLWQNFKVNSIRKLQNRWIRCQWLLELLILD